MILQNASAEVATLPEIGLELDARPATVTEFGTLIEVLVQQRLSLPALCELLFIDPTPQLTEGRSPRPGQAIRISVADRPMFEGDVTAVFHEYGPDRNIAVRIRAYDRLHRLRKRQPVRVLEELSPAGLARSLVQDLGLTVAADVDGPPWQKLTQWRQSDFDLLAAVCDRCGLYFDLRGDTLTMMSLAGAGAAVRLTLGESLHEARVEFNAAASCSAVTTSAWDPSRVELRHGTANTPRTTLSRDSASSPEAGDDDARTIVGDQVRDDAQAEAIAQAELDRRRARNLTLWAVTDGDPALRPGVCVDVRGVAPAAEGIYVLTSITHSIDTIKGFVSEISSVPPAPLPRPDCPSVAWGIVTSSDDPDGLGRVKVSLPTHRNVESDWMSVLTPGAGANRGMVWLPSRDDHVLVLGAGGEPSHGVVIGGLFGARGAVDRAGVKNGVVSRYSFVTPGGRRINLDDGAKSLRLEDGNGSFIELSPQRLKVHAKANLTIEAPGKTIFIRGKSVRFKRT